MTAIELWTNGAGMPGASANRARRADIDRAEARFLEGVAPTVRKAAADHRGSWRCRQGPFDPVRH